MSIIQVLGCSSGFCHGANTSSMLVDNYLLLDCGSGVQNLSIDQLRSIKHVILTHSHMDHMLFLPLLIDINYEIYHKNPLCIYASPETIDGLKKHIFNNIIWPDFSLIPSAEKPSMRFFPQDPYHPFEIMGFSATLVPVTHTVPSSAIKLTNEAGKSILFSGDTTENDTLWQEASGDTSIEKVIVECTFTDTFAKTAVLSKHYHSSMLAKDIHEKCHADPEILLTHLRVGAEAKIESEVKRALSYPRLSTLSPNQTIKF